MRPRAKGPRYGINFGNVEAILAYEIGLIQPIVIASDQLTIRLQALDLPFLLLPFRPTSDPSAVRTFVRHFFDGRDGSPALRGEALAKELRMTEPMVWTHERSRALQRLTYGAGYFGCDQVVLE